MKPPIHIALTGAAGQLAYSLIFRLASGEVFGPDQPLYLNLLEIPPVMGALDGVAMELDDCAYPLLRGMALSDNAEKAFDGVNWALLIGSKPRGPGMERKDLILDNGRIFVEQGRALEKGAADINILVVGNPANTNCLIAMNNAASIPKERWGAMTRLDHNRAAAQLAKKGGVPISEVTNVTIWGNHSSTQYPDFINAKIGGKPVTEIIQDQKWLEEEFISLVQKRGSAIIEARGVSSAASAANGAIDHVKSMINPTPEGDWFSAGVCSDGSYGIQEGLIFSFPLRNNGNKGNNGKNGHQWEIVKGIEFNQFAQQKIDNTLKELLEEKDIVREMLG